MSDTLIVFLKQPQPGAVKTRLAEALGPEAAAELYRAMAEEVVRRTHPRGGEYRRFFFYTPDEARCEMGGWFPVETWLPQRGEDLGARMVAAFDDAFRRGARRTAIIGTDAPSVSRERVIEAFEALGGYDVAVGPASDGGYYLLALGSPRPELFEGIAWSTPSVLAQTLERAATLGLRVRLLKSLSDIDTMADVRSEWPQLRALLRSRPTLAAALAAALEDQP
jgi:rSAM/selenodomain-associated transferase 1